MKRTQTLRQSLIASHTLVSLVPLLFIAFVILFFIIQDKKRDFILRIDLLSQSINNQIQMFMDQPLASLKMVGSLLDDIETLDSPEVTRLLNTNIRESLNFDSIYLLDPSGTVINVGLSDDREKFRSDLLGIHLGHKEEVKAVQLSQSPVWSDTFLSLTSRSISVTLYIPAGENVLAADINLHSLEQFIYKLSVDAGMTMVIDRNGAILFHPNPDMVGKSIMLNHIGLVAATLEGREQQGPFTLWGTKYFGSSTIINSIGWIALVAIPSNFYSSSLVVPLLIIGGGICSAILFSLVLAYYRAKKVAALLTEVTLKTSIIAQGDYSHLLPSSDFTELQQLADSINHMGASIQKREAELRENELKYRELVENTSNLVLRLDGDLIVTYANHTLYNLTGMTEDKAIGVHFRQCIAADDWAALETKLDGWIAGKTGDASIECRIDSTNAGRYYLLLAFNFHYDDVGFLADVNIIGHDMTERYRIEQQQKELEEKRQQSQKMEILGLMAGGVAHDLNNILSGIVGLPEMLLIKLKKEDPLRKPLEMIKTSGERAAAVVADLLTIARGSMAVRQVLDINELIADYCTTGGFVQIRERFSQISWKFYPESNLWACSCSRSHIEKTLMNLILNAFESIAEIGEVHVQTSNIAPDQISTYTTELPIGYYIAITVKDNGTGISGENLKKIFEPFFSRKGLGRSGTGLGLAVAWESVREHHGTILVSSSSKGTRFTVMLPAIPEYQGINEEKVQNSLHKGHGEHIVVVDDEETLREIALDMLATLGYRTTAFKSGEDALDYLKKNQVDLVLLDMQMDPGMSGRETYEKVLEIHPHQKALIATGFSTSFDVVASLQAGAAGCIKKPYNIETLAREVHKSLHSTPSQ